MADETNGKIQKMILAGAGDECLRYVRDNCATVRLTAKTLGMLFEIYAGIDPDSDDPMSCFSREVTIEELKRVHPDFESANGCHWARSDQSYLGKKYIIVRRLENGKTGRVVSVRLDGPNRDSVKKFRLVRRDIREEISRERCAVLDVGTNIEVDHKSGRYADLSNISPGNQRKEDFQPLSKAVNDAKRQHCRECLATGKRYDARRLGYKEGWIAGDGNTPSCVGCYWYDPRAFNRLISKDYGKDK